MGQSLIRLVTEQELEALHVETFINTTTKVTKVSDESALRGIIRGNTKTAKKAIKDVALSVSHLFPDSAYNTTLDTVADNQGIAPRFAAAQSSTWVRVVGAPGTIYTAGINTVSDNKGNIFDLQTSSTLGVKGFDYVKVRSQQSGASTNVDPYTIINISPSPVGHVGLINEYAGTGGRDAEDDDTFRQRIKEGPDIFARGTLSYLTQAFTRINTNVLRVIYEGINQSGKVVLSILTVNGVDLTDNELDDILSQAGQYLSLTELAPIGTLSYGVELKNVDYYVIDISCRIDLFDVGQLDNTVKEIQQKWSKSVDFRFWDSSLQRVEWDTLFLILKSHPNVRYTPDQYFSPSVDLIIPKQKFPRFRGFIAYDLDGNVLVNQSGTIDSVFYPTDIDINFSETVL